MQFLYVGYYVDDSVFYEIQAQKINNMSVARQKLEVNLIGGLLAACEEADSFDLVSYVPTRKGFSVPAYSELFGQRMKHFSIDKKSLHSMLGAMKDFYRYLDSFGAEKLRGLRVIMYDLNPVFLIPLALQKKRYGIKLVTICAEVPRLRRARNMKAKVKHGVLSLFQLWFDGYILLTRGMAEKLNCGDRPWIVMEGVAPKPFGTPKAGKKNVVMYAGGLAQDNNVRLLVDCCMSVPELDELWICGVGPDQTYVEEKAKEDPRIRYFGMVENERVREMETRAKVLVNLRNPEIELTKYSFPSKILEYIASGAMVLTTRLDGIPEEYFQYISPLDPVSVEGLKNALTGIFSMTDEEYLRVCHSVQRFICEEKNSKRQSGRIMDFVRGAFLEKEEPHEE